jgi:cytochrome c5
VYLPNHILSRRVSFIFSLGSIFGLVVLAAPSKSLAQTATAPSDSGPAAMAPTSPSPTQPAVELPDGDGKAIATQFCQDCHRLTNVVKARKAPDDWHDTVQLMMDRGARLPQDKFDTLVQYLAKNFGPQTAAPAAGATPAAVLSSDSPNASVAQTPKPVELPEGDGKAIATQFCQDCHKLTNLVKAHKAPDDWHDTVQLMMDRGARLPQDKFDTLIQYLAKNFGPKPDATTSAAGSPDATPAASSPSNR